MIDDFILDMQRVFSITNHNYSYFTRLNKEYYRIDLVMKDVFKHVLRMIELDDMESLEIRKSLFSYFKYLHRGYSAFDLIFMKNQDVNLHEEVLHGFLNLLREHEDQPLIEFYKEHFTTFKDWKAEGPLLVSAIDEHQLLTMEQHEEIKSFARFVLKIPATIVQDFLTQYQRYGDEDEESVLQS